MCIVQRYTVHYHMSHILCINIVCSPFRNINFRIQFGISLTKVENRVRVYYFDIDFCIYNAGICSIFSIFSYTKIGRRRMLYLPILHIFVKFQTIYKYKFNIKCHISYMTWRAIFVWMMARYTQIVSLNLQYFQHGKKGASKKNMLVRELAMTTATETGLIQFIYIDMV